MAQNPVAMLIDIFPDAFQLHMAAVIIQKSLIGRDESINILVGEVSTSSELSHLLGEAGCFYRKRRAPTNFLGKLFAKITNSCYSPGRDLTSPQDINRLQL